MSEPNSIINLGDLSKPATVLIEKISDAIGGVFKPWQIRRVAQAEAQAELISAKAGIKANQLEQRALSRFLFEETRKQNNIENIIQKSLPNLQPTADPSKIEDDWIANFFDKFRLVSDSEMQDLWAKVLAGEGNAPGSFSKRTVNLVSSLDKEDAKLFQKLCSFNWRIGERVPLIFDHLNEIYNRNGINFTGLKHLDSLGLISFESLAGYLETGFQKIGTVAYHDRTFTLEFPTDRENSLQIGKVLLTSAGAELSTICESAIVDGFVEYVLQEWVGHGIKRLEVETNL